MQQIITVIEDREELKTEKNVMLQELRNKGFDDIKTLRHSITETAATVARLAGSEQRSAAARDEAVSQVKSMMEQTDELDVSMLTAARDTLRPSLMSAAREQLRQTYGKDVDAGVSVTADKAMRELLGEKVEEQHSLIERIHKNAKLVSKYKNYATGQEGDR